MIDIKLILGGFALFLFGIYYMGEGLKNIAGDKLKYYIEKFTNKPWKGILVGTIITAFIQSSSATTAIAIGFVRAGLMKLDQVFGVIMGANIGTTITSFLIGLKVEEYALFFVFLGVLFVTFSSKKKVKYTGEIILGFGVLFYGLSLMGGELKNLKDLEQFTAFAKASNDNGLIGLFAGTIISGIIQSSSAFVGIVQKLYESNALTLLASIPLVLGSNIGTTVTAVLASLGGNTSSIRAATLHVFFNVLGTIIFMIFLIPFVSLIEAISAQLQLEPMMQIGTAHIIFNVVTTIVVYPFMKPIISLIKKIIRGEEENSINQIELDLSLATSLPAGALSLAKEQTLHMGNLGLDILSDSQRYFTTKDTKYRSNGRALEEAINTLDTKLTNYLMTIGRSNVGIQDTDEFIETLQVIKSIERIGDISTNLFEFYEIAIEQKGQFSDSAIQDINTMYGLVSDMVVLAIQNYKNKDNELIHLVFEKEDQLDALEKQARKNHLKRVGNNQAGNEIANTVYLDILSNIERIGDHAINIVKVSNNDIPLHDGADN